MGTPDFSVPALGALASSPEFEVACVVTQPDRKQGRGMKLSSCAVKVAAEKLGLPVRSPEKVNNDEIYQWVESEKFDLAIVIAFGQILSRKFLALFPLGVINIHGSLLPHLRGAAPIQRALMLGDQASGISYQKMVYELDAGDILESFPVEIESEWTARELYQNLSELSGETIQGVIGRYISGQTKLQPQDASRVTLAPKIEKAEQRVRWTDSAHVIINRYRGLQANGGAKAQIGEQEIKLSKISHHVQQSFSKKAGEILIKGNVILIQTGDGAVEVQMLQPMGRPAMSAQDYINGYGLKAGEMAL